MKWTTIAMVFCLLVSCAPSPVAPVPTATATPLPPASRTPKPSVTPYPTPTRAPTWTPEPSNTPPSPFSTPDVFAKYFIDSLRAQPLGVGAVKNTGVISNDNGFMRYSIQYPSDGLNISGFMNVPPGNGPFPVIIALHGYLDPADYKTLDYTTAFTDDITTKGYIVVHPNMRNFPPSDQGDALFRDGYVTDVLNLLALIHTSAGKPGLFQHANAQRIGLWAHSMGGDIALKVAVISRDVKAVFLLAPMSGDEQKNSNFFKLTLGGPDFQKELMASSDDFKAISAETYYKDITAAVQIHHGTGDTVIPSSWSEDTCQKLKNAGVDVVCYFYQGAEHTFKASYIAEYNSRLYDFFNRFLKK